MLFTKKKVLILLPYDVTGGAEKNMRFLAKKLPEAHLIYLTGHGDEDSATYLRGRDTLTSYFHLLLLLRKQKFEGVVITSLVHLNLYARIFHFVLSPNFKLIIREAAVLSKYYERLNLKLTIFKLLTRLFINCCDLTISQSLDMSDDLLKKFKLKPEKLRLIYNPVDKNKLKNMSQQPCFHQDFCITSDYLNLIFVGRLEKQKNISELIEIILQVSRKVKLFVIGDGSEKEVLLDKVKKNNAEDRIIFLGEQKNPFYFMINCDLFLSTSFYEGSPNTIAESLALGIPVISYKCMGGVSELLIDKIGCKLIEMHKKEEFILSIETFHKAKYVYDLDDLTEEVTINSYKKLVYGKSV